MNKTTNNYLLITLETCFKTYTDKEKLKDSLKRNT